ncbi:MAG TPA: ECF transporter S component [Anaerolineales bacterium]|nr:ECF transporter S component [Anaerolineales bacterium]HNN12791.1 ECF transporter S component [Anaerolineales bacterium]
MKQRYFSTFQLILLALFSALVIVAKIALRTPLQLSGHSGIFWMAIIIVGARVVPKLGASSIIGVTSGILASFLGLGDFGALNTFLSYAMVGVGSDLMLWLLRSDTENLVVAIIVGIFGHLGKFLTKWLFGVITGAPIGFVALGLLQAFLSYVIFGALGGLLGWLTLKALKRAGFFAYMAEKR